MPSSKLPIYVFRGTTKEYPGSKNSMEMPYTCTTTHPVKALWFALECYPRNPELAVVYLARLERLAAIESSYNHLHKLEDEIGFFIPPLQFYSLCEGFIDIGDF